MDNLTGQYILPVIVPLVVAILAMAFPLVQSATSRISEHYKSSLLARTFQKECSYRCFVFFLAASLFALLLYLLQLPALPRFANCWVVENSASLLVYLSAFLLVSTLLRLALITDAYNDQRKLSKRLVHRYNRKNKLCGLMRKVTPKKFVEKSPAFDKDTFNAISRLMNFSINNADEDLAREMFSFFAEAFVLFRRGKEGKEITYPDEFYNAVFEASEQLCLRQRKTVSYYNDGSLYDLFIDPFQDTKLSEKTIRFMWMCVIQDVEYGKYDNIFGLWKKLYQQASLVLDNNPDKQGEKEKYVEFGQVLCSYVMANGEYETVRKMLEFTQMKPAKYVLTPSSTQGVVDSYFAIDKYNDFGSHKNPVYFESLYPQPGLDGVDAGDKIQHRVYDFLGLAFLWQYNLLQSFQTPGYSDSVDGGSDAAVKQKTIGILERLRRNVETVCNNQQLCDAVGLKGIDYSNAYNGHKSPKQWFEDNIQSISNDLAIQRDADERNMTISTDLVQQFNEHVAKSCKEMLADIKPFLSDYDKTHKTASFSLSWRRDVERKSHVLRSMNYTEVAGTLLAQDFRVNMWLPLLHMNVTRYSLEEEDAISVIVNKISRKRLIIFNFGVWIDEAKLIGEGVLKKNDNKLYNKHGVEIVSVKSYLIHPALVHSFLLIAKADLPSLVITEVDKVVIDELKLSKFEPSLPIYTSVIDFNLEQWDGIKQKYCRDVGNEAKYAMFCSYINGKLCYKPTSKVMQLNIYNQFTDRFTPQRIDEVEDVWKRQKEKS